MSKDNMSFVMSNRQLLKAIDDYSDALKDEVNFFIFAESSSNTYLNLCDLDNTRLNNIVNVIEIAFEELKSMKEEQMKNGYNLPEYMRD